MRPRNSAETTELRRSSAKKQPRVKLIMQQSLSTARSPLPRREIAPPYIIQLILYARSLHEVLKKCQIFNEPLNKTVLT